MVFRRSKYRVFDHVKDLRTMLIHNPPMPLVRYHQLRDRQLILSCRRYNKIKHCLCRVEEKLSELLLGGLRLGSNVQDIR